MAAASRDGDFQLASGFSTEKVMESQPFFFELRDGS